MASLVSIILPTFNRRKYITKTIDSVVNQTYEEWELIIVDDASTDGTMDLVLTKYKAQLSDKLKYIKLEQNSGASKARNIGIESARGKYITFIDSDDIYHIDKIAKQVKQIESSTLLNVGIVTCGRIDYRNGVQYSSWLPSEKGAIIELLFMGVKIGAGTPFLMVKREAIEKGVRFDTNINVVEDFDFVAQVLFKGYQLDYVSESLVNVHHYNTDRNFNYSKAFLARDYLYRKYYSYIESNNKVKSYFLFKSLTFYSLFKEEYDTKVIKDFRKCHPLIFLGLNVNKTFPLFLKRINLKLISILYKKNTNREYKH